MDNWIYLIKYTCLPTRYFLSTSLPKFLFICISSFIEKILKILFLQQTTSYNQQLKDNLKELKGDKIFFMVIKLIYAPLSTVLKADKDNLKVLKETLSLSPL